MVMAQVLLEPVGPKRVDPSIKHCVFLGRRMDSLELRMAGSDQANRALLEQLMKLNQDIKVISFFPVLLLAP